MKYKEFVEWCNDRACDGCWGRLEAITCITLMEDINRTPFWKRKKKWEKAEKEIVNEIVNPINKMIFEKQLMKSC